MDGHRAVKGIADAAGPRTAATPLVSVRGARVVRDGRVALDGVDFHVDRGECVAVLGPNGAGKSTLLRLLALVDPPTAGTLAWEGLGPPDEPLLARRRIATVAQEPYLFSGSVLENVAEGLRYRGMPRDVAVARAREALAACGAASLETRRASELSGGEVKRVAIARAIATGPELLLLDEPLAHVDEATSRDLLALFASFSSRGNAVVIATHELSEVARLARRVVALRAGRIDPRGTENLLLGEVWHEGGMHWFVHGSGFRLAVATHRTGRAWAKIEPEEILVSAEPVLSSARNCLPGIVVGVEEVDPIARVRIDVGVTVVAHVTPQSVREMGIAEGKRLFATFKATAVRVV